MAILRGKRVNGYFSSQQALSNPETVAYELQGSKNFVERLTTILVQDGYILISKESGNILAIPPEELSNAATRGTDERSSSG